MNRWFCQGQNFRILVVFNTEKIGQDLKSSSNPKSLATMANSFRFIISISENFY